MAKKLKNTKERGQRYRKDVIEHYGGKCYCCGESNYKFLSIDHVNGIQKGEKRISGLHFYSRIKKHNYPDDYQVLCFNCNLGRALNNGICPHQDQNKPLSIAGMGG